MARRASSSLHPGIIIGIAAAVVVAIVAAQSLFKHKKPSFGDVSSLNVEDFLENGNSLRGNEYSIEGKIDEKLRWTPSRGQIVSLRVSTKGGEELIGIEIPPNFNNLNVEREQRYAMRVKVRQGGIPVATAVNRL
ncbi:MAG: hypothetical protein DVB25_04495 [Verrucomicrobia bacterium]|nr:MAG: hypothetical protein DVB25_04495 [Verrucomicrobiota bacterium]